MRFIKENSTVTIARPSDVHLMMPVINFSPEESLDRLQVLKIKQDVRLRMLRANRAIESFDYNPPNRVSIFLKFYRKFLA